MPGPARVVGVTLLAGTALAGCASAGMAGGRATASPAGGSGPRTVTSSPRPTAVAASPSSSNDSNGAARPVAGGNVSGPGCAAWPAGSTRTTLLITRASEAKRYCVRVGQTVQVSSAGTLSLMAGSKPPRLTGTALVAAPGRPGQAVRSPAATYTAVRAGVATLTVVRLPCRSIPASPAAGQAGEMAYVARAGGAPVGAQCQLVQALWVTIAVS